MMLLELWTAPGDDRPGNGGEGVVHVRDDKGAELREAANVTFSNMPCPYVTLNHQ